MNSVILEDVSLCSIVRDEIMNPAGGIERFVDSHIPYVEEAVIVDTGSVYGTREKLEELQGKYSNLKIYDVPFENYSDARNKSLEFVKTKQALILDADELLTHKKPQDDWEKLKVFLENYQEQSIFGFGFFEIGLSYIIYQNHILSTRLFDKGKVQFEKGVYEVAITDGRESRNEELIVQGVDIKHFVPSMSAIHKKETDWYGQSFQYRDDLPRWQIPPSMIKGFEEWKKFNPKRNDYI